jgi:hypothetical protein
MNLSKSFETFMRWLRSQNMLFCEYMQFFDQFLLLLYLFIELLNNKCENIVKWLEKSKKLRSHVILVYEHHIKISSDFDKELLNIPNKSVCGSHSPM